MLNEFDIADGIEEVEPDELDLQVLAEHANDDESDYVSFDEVLAHCGLPAMTCGMTKK